MVLSGIMYFYFFKEEGKGVIIIGIHFLFIMQESAVPSLKESCTN